MKQETIEKCYSFLEEMQVAAINGVPFNYDGFSKSIRCTPMYYKFAIEAGYFKKEDKILVCTVDAITREHAECVVKLSNQYFSKKQKDEVPIEKKEVKQVFEAIERNRSGEQGPVKIKKEQNVRPDMRDAKCLELFTVEQLICELKRRGFSGEIKISHCF